MNSSLIPAIPIILGVVLGTPSIAQGKIYVVDAAMGPGAHYRDIPAAVAKVLDGDRIIVRKGSYSGFVLNKGVTIIGQDGATISRKGSGGLGWIDIHSVQRGQNAVLQNLSFSVNLNALSSLWVYDCAGRVLLEELNSSTFFLVAWGAQQVFVSSCDVGGLYAKWAKVALSQCNLNRADLRLELQDACRIIASKVVLSGCNVTGYPIWGTAQPAVILQSGSQLTVTGDGSTRIRPCSCSIGSSVDVWSSSMRDTIVIDPRMAATFGASYGKPNITRRTVPYLNAEGSPLGGIATITLKAGAGQAYLLAIGPPGDIVLMPQLGGYFWLDLKATILVASGSLDTKGVVQLSIPVPNAQVLFGLSVVWQGAAGPPAGQLWLSNPSAYVHGF